MGHGACVTRPSLTTPALLIHRLTTTHTATRTSSYVPSDHTNPDRREGADRVAALPVASVRCVYEAGLGRSDRHTGTKAQINFQ